ncbi:hypothetical protein [Deinococcus yavapaiensis]|uniref:Uncharacterized protein n=1 Tax=Deinococcus yavapaiensis KR-236 TaxID=694435 RepID=A0A318SI19_9DEIO|nr:hypothetical protein [Deinococcus yavapaiensis]PYE51022.1 hypothetical protein DES52_11689 [Deinococcus yavapaiensis KR-236]
MELTDASDMDGLASLSTVVARVHTLILQRSEQSLHALLWLEELLDRVLVFPNDLTWPKDVPLPAPVDVKDAIDDLTDVAVDFDRALHLATFDEVAGWSYLRFHADIH